MNTLRKIWFWVLKHFDTSINDAWTRSDKLKHIDTYKLGKKIERNKKGY